VSKIKGLIGKNLGREGKAAMKKDVAIFEEKGIRRVYDEKAETWYFSVVDIIQVLTEQPDYNLARNYWKVLKNRLKREGSEVVTNCNRLKLTAQDGKKYLTDVAAAETLLRLVQSVPSPPRRNLSNSGWRKSAMNASRRWPTRKSL
jgi:hypothetical protein